MFFAFFICFCTRLNLPFRISSTASAPAECVCVARASRPHNRRPAPSPGQLARAWARLRVACRRGEVSALRGSMHQVYRFSATSATFSYRDLVLAYSHYHCATFRSTARCPRSCVRAPPRPSCAATATAAAAMCSPLWLLIARARLGRRAVPHFGAESFFAQHFLYGVCIQNMARRCAMTRAAAAHSERGGVVRFLGFVGSPPRAGHFRAAAGR